MPASRMCTVAVALSLACFLGSIFAAEEGGPRAAAPESRWDWGTVFAGEEVVHSFPIVNEGTAELKILKVQESCKCTKKEFTEVIPAGGQGHVTLAVDTRGMKGPTEKRATITTSDPASPSLTLTFGGVVRDALTVSPVFPTLKGLMGGDPAKTTLSIAPATEIPIDTLAVTSKSKLFKAQVERLEKEKAFRVQIETLPGLTVDSTQEDLIMEALAGGKKLQVTVRVHVTLEHRVTVKPAWVIYNFIETEKWEKDSSAVPTRTIAIKGQPGVAFTVSKVETEGGFFAAELSEVTAKSEYRLTVTLLKRPDGPIQPARGSIKIHTSDSIEKVLDVRVTAFFKTAEKK